MTKTQRQNIEKTIKWLESIQIGYQHEINKINCAAVMGELAQDLESKIPYIDKVVKALADVKAAILTIKTELLFEENYEKETE